MGNDDLWQAPPTQPSLGLADEEPETAPTGIPDATAYVEPDAAPDPIANLADPDLPFWLALNRVKGIGPSRFRTLIESFGTAGAAWRATPAAWQAAGIDSRTTAAFATQRRSISPEAERDTLVKLRVGALRLVDPGYPKLLREIAHPPAILYVRGTISSEDDWAIAIVGTRKVTAYGRHVTQEIAAELAGARVTVLSGLARGVDTVAHTSALDADGRTLAVLGCGPDLVYPPDNARLAARIIEAGAIVTEFAPGTQPEPGNFPARNRLISGLSLGVLVTEAPDDSGALITCRFAGEQGRDVFAVPGNVINRTSLGCNRLIQDGAKLVISAADILSELNLHLVPQQRELLEALPASSAEDALLRALDAAGGPLHVDELIRETGLPAGEVSATLAMLELMGRLRLTGPMSYLRVR
ncbi:MAG TPA: DNA-processing protein DprA [Ktedonobacterales bacterium]